MMGRDWGGGDGVPDPRRLGGRLFACAATCSPRRGATGRSLLRGRGEALGWARTLSPPGASERRWRPLLVPQVSIHSVLETLRQAQGERKRGAFGMGQGVESPDFSGACLSGAGLVPLGFRVLLKVGVESRLRTNIVLKSLRVKRQRHILGRRGCDFCRTDEAGWQGVGLPPLIPLEGLGACLRGPQHERPHPIEDGFPIGVGNDGKRAGDGFPPDFSGAGWVGNCKCQVIH